MLASVQRVNGSAHYITEDDALAVEEPLEIRLAYRVDGRAEHKPISITMRTPGNDLELAAGFLFTEGILTAREQISRLRHCGKGAESGSETNTVVVELADNVAVDLKRLERHFYTTSSCGVCGKTSIKALSTGAAKLNAASTHVAAGVIRSLPGKLRMSQSVFDRTGGLHAAALFDTAGELQIVREDVGRHNALDTLIGARFLAGDTPLGGKVLLLSGRASFELIQKALMAGIAIVAAVGAPSSLAVELASEYGMTLAGFVRDDRFNIYTGGERVV